MRVNFAPYIEPPGLGIAWIWSLSETHPFHSCGVWHDEQYDARRRGDLLDETSERIDLEFYWQCMAVACAERSIWLKVEAELFFQITRAWGDNYWPPLSAPRKQSYECEEKNTKRKSPRKKARKAKKRARSSENSNSSLRRISPKRTATSKSHRIK